MPSPITTAALDAAAAAAADGLNKRRKVLAGLLAGKVDTSTLTVLDADSDVVVFTDGVVHLAVDRDGGIHLVSGTAGDWTDLGEVSTLVDLGQRLTDVTASTPMGSA